jgi:hypothetical protein
LISGLDAEHNTESSAWEGGKMNVVTALTFGEADFQTGLGILSGEIRNIELPRTFCLPPKDDKTILIFVNYPAPVLGLAKVEKVSYLSWDKERERPFSERHICPDVFPCAGITTVLHFEKIIMISLENANRPGSECADSDRPNIRK